MMHKLSCLLHAAMLLLVWSGSLAAQEAVEKSLPLDAAFNADGTALELNWFDATPPRVGSVTVKRRLYGRSGGQTWQPIASALGPVMRYTDTQVTPGVAYEYQVLRSARDIIDVGYWVAGTRLPATARRGHVYVIVDETLADALAPRLARFEQDLTGDGWQVTRHLAPRGDPRLPAENLPKALALRQWLQARYREDPFGQHSIVLLGRIPALRSGNNNPDGHARVPLATDLFYADMDGRWTATRDGVLLDSRVPGDFIEMQIGRIDFSNLSAGDRETEIAFIRAYLDKNHHWRMGMLGDLREAYGGTGHLIVENHGLRNIVGPERLTSGGHHDVGEAQPWLWGSDFGSSDGRKYLAGYANKAVFALNFGSGKQHFDGPYNAMTALLAQPWYTLAVGWGARPAWWVHHMALGGTVGEMHMRTVNNGSAAEPYRDTMDYFPTGIYMWRNPVWVNLLGDPTLSAFPLAPAQNVTARADQGRVHLSWDASPDPDVLGYRVYRMTPGNRAFEAIDDGTPLTDLSFTDTAPLANARYMVRAYGLKDVHAGSFYTFSQGRFAIPGEAASPAPETAVQIRTQKDTPVALPPAFSQATPGQIRAIIAGPAQGRLTQEAEGWVYTPAEGFSGTVTLRTSVWDGLGGNTGSLSITVAP